MEEKEVAKKIFLAGVEAALPGKLIESNVTKNGNLLTICGWKLDLTPFKQIYVIGAGKASALMAAKLEDILGDSISAGTVIVKYGHGAVCKHIQVIEAGHPYPDQNGVDGTREIMELVKNAGQDDLVICLFSGGGSSLLADFPQGSKLDELIRLNQLFIPSGATIQEMNSVRKHLSGIKGGQLASMAWPAQLVSLVLSDVVGDPLDVIASGPTVPDPTTFEDAMNVIRKYHLTEKIPGRLLKRLIEGTEGKIPETPKEGDKSFGNVENHIIGSNRIALQNCRKKAVELGFETFLLKANMTGNTLVVAQETVRKAVKVLRQLKRRKKVCLLLGGETTLTVNGPGLGGRNQHFALVAAKALRGTEGITLLAGGTDGNDGPTDAAGALVDGSTWDNAIDQLLQPEAYLQNFDSYHFFKKAGNHLITGPTMTNVMDLVVVLIKG